MFVSSRHLATGPFRVYQVANVMGELELAICAGAFGMDDTLRNSLAIEVGEEIDEMEVLKQERSILANSLAGLWVVDWTAVRGGVNGPLFVPKSPGRLIVEHHGEYRQEYSSSARQWLRCGTRLVNDENRFKNRLLETEIVKVTEV